MYLRMYIAIEKRAKSVIWNAKR